MSKQPQKYFEEYDATTMPWVESPFFFELLERSDLSNYERQLAIQYHEEGYIIIDSGLSEDVIDAVVADTKRLSQSPTVKTQESGYHYSESPRLFEGWKVSKHIQDVALNPAVTSVLKMLYRKTPLPFQTINFLKGSNQPLHSDVIHFHTIPHRWLAASWTAFEDMDEENGTLVYIPGSHKLGIYDFYDLKITIPEYGKQFESYEQYEEFIRQLVQALGYTTKKFVCKKGQVLVWSANLIHGGDIILDDKRTRFSQASHYYFDGCDRYFAPMFSSPFDGKYANKDLTTKNITDHRHEQ